MQPTDFTGMFASQLAEMDARAKEGKPQAPSPDSIAFYVRMQRGFWGWKQDTLASMAGVSLSTIERVERGEAISSENLDRIAVALRQAPGTFTMPRLPLGAEETLRKIAESAEPFDGRIWIPVRPVTGQRQVAELASSHFYVADASRLSESCAEDAQGDIASFVEYLDLVSFILSTEEKESIVKVHRSEPVKRRKLYDDVLACARETERRTNSVILAGTYEAETDSALMPKAQVTVIGFFPKSADPAAIKRRTLAVPMRISLDEAWTNFCAEVDSWKKKGPGESTQ